MPLNANGARHELLKKELQRYWFPKVATTNIDLVTETTLRYAPDSFLEPDFLFWPRSIPISDIACPTALLLVEVADSSIAYDTGRKARIFAGLGLREYWVVNANTLVTSVHLDPGPDGYSVVADYSGGKRIAPHLVPDLALALDDLRIEPIT